MTYDVYLIGTGTVWGQVNYQGDIIHEMFGGFRRVLEIIKRDALTKKKPRMARDDSVYLELGRIFPFIFREPMQELEDYFVVCKHINPKVSDRITFKKMFQGKIEDEKRKIIRLTDEIKSQIVDLKKRGFNVKQTAERSGVSISSVRKVFDEI